MEETLAPEIVDAYSAIGLIPKAGNLPETVAVFTLDKSKEFHVGDIVTLKSGGEPMTIVEICFAEMNEGSIEKAECSWWEQESLHTRWFPLVALQRICTPA